MNKEDIVKKIKLVSEKCEKYCICVSEADGEIDDVFFSGNSIYIGTSGYGQITAK